MSIDEFYKYILKKIKKNPQYKLNLIKKKDENKIIIKNFI